MHLIQDVSLNNGFSARQEEKKHFYYKYDFRMKFIIYVLSKELYETIGLDYMKFYLEKLLVRHQILTCEFQSNRSVKPNRSTYLKILIICILGIETGQCD